MEHRDILPTLVDLISGEKLDDVDGESFLPLMKKDEWEKTVWRDRLHGEHTLGHYSNQYLLKDTYKYIWYTQTGVEHFFDLEKDPKEMKNLIEDTRYAEKIKELKTDLISKLENRPEGFVKNGKLVVGRQQSSLINWQVE